MVGSNDSQDYMHNVPSPLPISHDKGFGFIFYFKILHRAKLYIKLYYDWGFLSQYLDKANQTGRMQQVTQ